MEDEVITHVINLATEAGNAILNIYHSLDYDIESKSDESPLTKADKEAHRIIERGLADSQFPILSEEGQNIPYSSRMGWDLFWLVDPLDGTKEFIKRNGEFTVNIALIERGKPIFGVVYAPDLDKLYYGGLGMGAFTVQNGNTTRLSRMKNSSSTIRIVASRSHLNQETVDFINQFKHPEIVSMGSSLKFMLIAENKADVYPRFAPTMEWDTAAAHAILLGLGIDVIEPVSKNTLTYNKTDLLNPFFIVNQRDG